MSARNIDRTWPYDSLVVGQSALHATALAHANLRDEFASVERLARQPSGPGNSARIRQSRIIRTNVTVRDLRCQRTLALAALANCLRQLRSAKYVVLTHFQKVPAIIRIIIAHVEHGFALFAGIPYQDALSKQELSQLLDEFGTEGHAEQSD